MTVAPEALALTAVLVNAPVDATTFTFSASGGFYYVATNGFKGTDTFTYYDVDAHGTSNIATVTLGIGMEPPVAVDDSFVVGGDGATTTVIHGDFGFNSGVLENDYDPEGNPFTAVKNTEPSHGSLILNANGTFTYTAAAGFRGQDSFTYFDHSVNGNGNVTTVRLQVGPPTANDDSYAGTPGQPLVVGVNQGVLANDTDVENDPMTAVQYDPDTPLSYAGGIVEAGPSFGQLVLNADGSFVYTPNAGFHGVDYFYYAAKDQDGTSFVARVTLNILGIRPLPMTIPMTCTRRLA